MKPQSVLRDPLFWIIAGSSMFHGLYASWYLVCGDLNLGYAWVAGDSWDWLANGLFFSGADVRYSGRSPLLPLIIALLDKLSWLPGLPLLIQAVFQGTVLAFYVAARRLHGSAPALVSALCLQLSYADQGFSFELMADMTASCLLFLSCSLAFSAEDRPYRYAIRTPVNYSFLFKEPDL